MELTGTVDEFPDPADDGLGESAELPCENEEWFWDTGVDVEEIAAVPVPLLFKVIELLPKLRAGDTLLPDLPLGEEGS